MVTDTRIWTDVDFDRDGKQISCLRLPFSSDRSAYGTIPIPIVCIRNGTGPTALLISGNHGDEYEGQVALNKLARQLDATELCGRIIILPALNYPAVDAGRRVSPLDQGNLNRLFPGNANGSPTEMIAHYLTEVLLPLAEAGRVRPLVGTRLPLAEAAKAHELMAGRGTVGKVVLENPS